MDQVDLNTVFKAEGSSSWVRNHSSIECDPQLYDRVVQAYNQAVDKHTQPAREARLAERARPMNIASALFVGGFMLVAGSIHLAAITGVRGKLFPLWIVSTVGGTVIWGIGYLKIVEEALVLGIASPFLWLSDQLGDSIDRTKAQPFMVREASLALFSESERVDFRSLCALCCSHHQPKADGKMGLRESWAPQFEITATESECAVDDKPEIVMGIVPNSWWTSEAQIIFPVWAYRSDDDLE